MAALLAVFTLLLFAAIDFLLHHRRQAPAPAVVTPAAPAAASLAEEPVYVAGYELPENLYYHPGHTWARVLAPDTVAVGMDDFARRLTGPVTGLRLPGVGSWLRQGGKAVRVEAEDRSAEMIAPVEGEVIEVNRELRRDPSLATSDPYGAGWLFKIRSANLAANLRNLLSGTLARRWAEDARDQLRLRLMALSGSVLQDGGEPSRDFARHLDAENWKQLTARFLLDGTPDGQGGVR